MPGQWDSTIRLVGTVRRNARFQHGDGLGAQAMPWYNQRIDREIAYASWVVVDHHNGEVAPWCEARLIENVDQGAGFVWRITEDCRRAVRCQQPGADEGAIFTRAEERAVESWLQLRGIHRCAISSPAISC